MCRDDSYDRGPRLHCWICGDRLGVLPSPPSHSRVAGCADPLPIRLLQDPSVAAVPMSDTLDVQRVFPQAVHDSLAELRRIAKAAKSKDDPALRRASKDELALAETLKLAWHCTGHNSRTGLPCRRAKLAGLQVCRRHGGALKHVQLAMRRRLAEVSPKILESQITRALDPDDNAIGFKASQDLMDRAGIGALVQAKVRASKKQDQSGAQVVVNIGFLG